MTDAGIAAPVLEPRGARAADRRRATPLVRELRAFYGGRRRARSCSTACGRLPTCAPHGFTLMGHPPLMVRPAELPLPAPPAELRIVAGRRRRDRGRLRAHARRRLSRRRCSQPFERVAHVHARRARSARAGTTSSATSTTAGRRRLGVRRRPTPARREHRDARRRARPGFGLAITAATIASTSSKPADARRERPRPADLRDASASSRCRA